MPILRYFVAAVIAVAAATASGPLAAQSYVDPATGLALDPPRPFAARAGQPRRQFDVTIDVASPSDKGHCTVGFKTDSQKASLSKADINALMAKPEWLNVYKSLFGQTGTVTDVMTFDHQGYTAIEMTITPKVGPAAGTVMSLSIIETPKGRTSFICITDRDSIVAVLPKFRAVRATIRAPE
jgi:hypothetical protein